MAEPHYITGKEIAAKWLKENGYDGLCNDECGCSVDDLAPCGDSTDDCMAAYMTHVFEGDDDYDLYSVVRPEIKEAVQPAANTQSIKCCCSFSDIPCHKHTVGGVIKSISLSLELNKECPVHNHWFL